MLDPQSLYSDTTKYLINKINQISNENERDILSMDRKVSRGSTKSTGNNRDEKPTNTMSSSQ